MTTIAKIIISATDQTKSAFASVNAGLERFKAQAGNLVPGLASVQLGFAGVGAAAGVAAAAMTRMVQQSLALLDQLDEAAQRTGISVERLSELRFGAIVSGVSFDALEAGLTRLSRAMVEAAGGSEEIKSVFDSMGVAVRDSSGSLRTAEEVLKDVADRFSTYEDGAEKAAIATKLFRNVDMILYLNEGRDGIERLAKEARQLGAVFDGDAAKASAAFNDNLARIKLASEGASAQLAGPLVKALADWSAETVKAIEQGRLFELMLRNIARYNPMTLAWRAIFGGGGGDAASGATGSWLTPEDLRRSELTGNNRRIRGPAPGGGNGKTAGGAAARDPYAEARRYLESLQKQSEKLEGLTSLQQALRDIETGRIGQVTPLLREQILETARLLDMHQEEKEQAEAMTKAWKEYEDGQRKLWEEARDLIESVRTPAEQFEATLQRINELALGNPFVDGETVARLNQKAWADYVATLEVAIEQTSELDEFQRRAAKNIQDQLGQGLYDAMSGNFKDIGQAFTQMLNRMVAEAAAAKISQALFGELVGGQGSGIAGGLMGNIGRALLGGGSTGPTTHGDFARMDRMGGSPDGGGFVAAIGSWFSKLMSFDVGTPYVPYDMVAKIHKGERIVPAAQNKGGWGGQVVQNFTFNGPVDRSTQLQLAAKAAAGLQRARRVM